MYDKYEFYERSVQMPAEQIKFFDEVYKKLRRKPAKIFREDFCGTYAISGEWVKLRRDNQAICVDLDPEPLREGKKRNSLRLAPEEFRRIRPVRKNVLQPVGKKADIISASNFSFYALKKWPDLLQYCKTTYRSLNKKGIFVLEMIGGAEFTDERKERTRKRKNGKPWFTYVWEQKRFNPVTREGDYAIHFEFPNGRAKRDQFVYDWRVWTIPEVRLALTQAGFKRARIFWEGEPEDYPHIEDVDGYYETEDGSNDFVWLCYVVAEKD